MYSMPQAFVRKYLQVAAVRTSGGELVIDMKPFADAIQDGRFQAIQLSSGQGVAFGPRNLGVSPFPRIAVPGHTQSATSRLTATLT
jgi:hypothetical protein